MKSPRLYMVVKRPDGSLAKIPVKPSQATCKRERRVIKDVQSGLWLYRQRYEYEDRRRREEYS